jgi:Tol biopolymer transport system component
MTPTPPVEVEKIAYTSVEDGQPTLWTMNTDGSERTRLTPRGTSSWHPLWSPNGKILAFLSTAKDGKVNIYTVRKGDTQLIQVTDWADMDKPDPAALQASFTWSPQSDQLAYIYKNQIWVVQLNSLEQTTLVSVDSAFSINSIAWAPHRDNKYISYTIRKGVNYYSVMFANPRLKDNLTLVNSSKAVPGISWTSGAETLAYLSGGKSVYTTTVEDVSPKVLITNASPDLAPFIAYSPADSSARLMLLAKQTVADTGYRVAMVDQASKSDQDTGTLKYLTPPGVTAAVWSPDGSRIAYVVAGELWVMDSSSGLNKTRIALTGIQSPDWSKK